METKTARAVFAFFIVLGIRGLTYGQGIAWVTDYRQGLALARETGKAVLVDFWATWCGPCRQMDETTYRDKDLIEDARSVICVKVDVDRDKEAPRAHGIRVIPTVVFLDPWENRLYLQEGIASAKALKELMAAMPADFRPAASTLRAARENEDDFAVQLEAGRFYERTPLLGVAREFYERAAGSSLARKEPKALDRARIALGLLAIKQGEAERSLDIFSKGLKACDTANEGLFRVGVGLANYRLGKVDKAKSAFEDVIARFPGTEAAKVAERNLSQMAKR